jgi:hypothetical protein
MRLRDSLRTPVLRYTAIAVVAFSVGSASVVLAASSGAMQLPVFRLADGTNSEQLAKVDAAGNVQVSVNNQPSTQQISGTVSVSNFPATQGVSVSNFPATQNVNVTGGSLDVSSSLATQSRFFVLSTQPGFTKAQSFPTINASLIIVDPRRSDVSFLFFNNTPSGINPTFGFRSPPGPLVIPLNQRIPMTSAQITCFNVVGDCEPTIAIVGD